ncbi:YsnF/AvaK domain-containing protein [Chamaesiphon sp.]|uniref:YsnF/AvaK domain-containing protein n=1 Tax=Chamaesiphon sp. TaxID=2814140 RepID=UPI00359391D9
MIYEQSPDRQPQPRNLDPLSEPPIHLQQQAAGTEILTDEVFSLLEERLIVNLNKRKSGEIVVRKEIETQTIQVELPVRREKLIVEQVSPEYKLLAQIDLGAASLADLAIADVPSSLGNGNASTPTTLVNRRSQPTVSGQIGSLTAASNLLNEIADLPAADWETVRIEIVLKDAKHQDRYQALFDRYCQP